MVASPSSSCFQNFKPTNEENYTYACPYLKTDVITSSLLSKTGKFVPTPVGTNCHISLLTGVYDFIRKLQWKSVRLKFSNSSRFFKKSDRFPPQALVPDHTLKLCSRIRSGVLSLLRQCPTCFPKDNLSADERAEMDRLSSNASVIITPVDKGSGWIIVPKKFYDAEAYRQLVDESVYTPLVNDVDIFVRQRLTNLLSQLEKKKFLSRREALALQPPVSPSSRTFYLLPKIHKSSWPFSLMPSGRPIVSDVKSVTRACASLVEYFLGPIARKADSYVRDSSHVISLIHDCSIEVSSFLVTFDIKSLYTNIPTDNGVAAVSEAFKKYPDPKRPDLTILTMLRLILTHNTFLFKGELFLQRQGTAMGCPFGPSYANIFLAQWEDKLFPCRPQLWLRFIDDIFFVWNRNLAELFNFRDFVNSIAPTIQVEMVFDGSCIHFLDLILSNVNGHFSYTVGFKPTDTHAILPANSFHPRHVFSAILFGQVYRWATHSSSYASFKLIKQTVQRRWRDQGYTRTAIRNAVRKVLSLTAQTPSDWRTGFFPCTGNCVVCIYGFYSKSVVNIFNNNRYLIFHKLSCKSTSVIYLIACKNCKKSYVGQTSRALYKRISQHLSDICTANPTSVSLHFTEHCSPSDFSFTVLEHCPQQRKRLEKENTWIRRLQTLQPNGLNVELNSKNDLHLIIPFSRCSQRVSRFIQRTVTDFDTCTSYRKHRNLTSVLTEPRRHS